MMLLQPQEMFVPTWPAAVNPRCAPLPSLFGSPLQFAPPRTFVHPKPTTPAPAPKSRVLRTRDGGLLIQFNFSGFLKSSVSVEVRGNQLHISADRPARQTDFFASPWESFFDQRPSAPSFRRTYALESWVATAAITATLDGAILNIKLPRKAIPKPSPRKIYVYGPTQPTTSAAAHRSMPQYHTAAKVEEEDDVPPPLVDDDYYDCCEDNDDDVPALIEDTDDHNMQNVDQQQPDTTVRVIHKNKDNKGKAPATAEQLAAMRRRQEEEEDGLIEDCEF